MRASLAVGKAVNWGYTKVYYFRDGFIGWRAAGHGEKIFGQRRPSLPSLHRAFLHDQVGILAHHALLDEGEQDALRIDQPPSSSEVFFHSIWARKNSRKDPVAMVKHVVKQRCRIG